MSPTDENILREFFDSDEEYERTAANWPVCPECGARRAVRCPVCQTVGDLFPPADAEFWDGSEPVVKPPEPEKCGCSKLECACHASCGETIEGEYDPDAPAEKSDAPDSASSPARPQPVDSDNQLFWGLPDPRKDPLPRLHDMPTITVTNPALAERERTLDLEPVGDADAYDEQGNPRLVVCTTCDEPFVPKFAPLCRCGHRFDEPDAEDEESSLDAETIARYQTTVDDAPLNGRIVWTLILLTAAGLIGALYSWWLFR